MGCCFCCLGENGQVKLVLAKFPAKRSQEAQIGTINLIVGRVGAASGALVAPVSGKPCVFYKVTAEEHVKYHEQVNDRMEERWRWERRFVEERGLDFYLLDPSAPHASVYIPGNRVPIKKHTEPSASAQSGGFISQFTGGNVPPSVHEMCNRNRFPINSFHQMKYTEESFDVREQIVALGVLQQGVAANGVSVVVMEPMTENMLNEEYFTANKWSKWDRKAWKTLTASPAVICSDDIQFHQTMTYSQQNSNGVFLDVCRIHTVTATRIRMLKKSISAKI
eukprot:gene7266-14813_t